MIYSENNVLHLSVRHTWGSFQWVGSKAVQDSAGSLALCKSCLGTADSCLTSPLHDFALKGLILVCPSRPQFCDR